MNERKHTHWPLRPSTTAYVLDGLASTLSDLIQESGSDIDRHQLNKLSALGITSSLCAQALAHWFGSRGQKTMTCWRRCRTGRRFRGALRAAL